MDCKYFVNIYVPLLDVGWNFTEQYKWFKKNKIKKYRYSWTNDTKDDRSRRVLFRFENKNDAALFKLTWG